MVGSNLSYCRFISSRSPDSFHAPTDALLGCGSTRLYILPPMMGYAMMFRPSPIQQFALVSLRGASVVGSPRRTSAGTLAR
jgi:hypothetical protein